MRGSTKRKSGIRRVITIMAALSLLVTLAAPGGAYHRPGRNHLVTVSALTGREPLIGNSTAPTITPNGRFIAFVSTSADLVMGDTNGASDVFVHDRRTGTTERVSVSSTGEQGVGVWLCQANQTLSSYAPSITPDGRHVAFLSWATNLVPEDTNGILDVFVHDRKTGETERVSVGADGSQIQDYVPQACFRRSGTPKLSTNGRHVAFASESAELVEGDANGMTDIFIHDRKSGKNDRVSVASDGSEAQSSDPNSSIYGGSTCPSIDARARFVAFTSDADNLVDDKPVEVHSRVNHVYVHDRKTGKTELIDRRRDDASMQLSPQADSCGTDGNSPGSFLSADGRYVLFESGSSDLVPVDTNASPDVFIHDRRTNRTQRVSITSLGEEGELLAPSLAEGGISHNGRYVTFSGFAHFDDRLDGASGDNGRGCCRQDAYIHDLKTGVTELISVAADGSVAKCQSANSTSIEPTVSADGRYVAYSSCNVDVVEGYNLTGINMLLFVRDRGPDVGVGGMEGPGPSKQEPPDDRICVADICIPPGAAVSSSDDVDDVDEALTEQGGNLYGASLAYRLQYEDLFAAIEVEHMPTVLPGASPIFYGLRFGVEGKRYEVRATSFNYDTFGLFNCSDSPTCTKVADLRGGYGTTGMRVVFSLPLDEIGLKRGGKLKDVTAFSALGSYLTGATRVLDTVRLK